MDILWSELTAGIPDGRQLFVIVLRLAASAVFGAIIGFEREAAGKAAGLRTHILVTTGSTVFILGCLAANMDADGLSRVVQGIATGIGFVGAGTVLKKDSEEKIQGITTSAGIWMAAAIGVTVGLGAIGIGLMAALLTLAVLRLIFLFESENRVSPKSN